MKNNHQQYPPSPIPTGLALILILNLIPISSLSALDDPTYPLHENGEYLCFVSGPDGKAESCRLWLFGRRLNDHLVEAYRLKKLGRYQGGAVATTGGMPLGEYEKDPVILNLNQFSYLRLIRIRRPRPTSGSSLTNWNADAHFRFTNRETTP